MGCDIHIAAEENSKGKWTRIYDLDYDIRNYSFFGWLAGVRNYSSVIPRFPQRGIPSDSCFGSKIGLHSFSYFMADEINEIDFHGIMIEDCRIWQTMHNGGHAYIGTCNSGQGIIKPLSEFIGPEAVIFLQNVIKHQNMIRLSNRNMKIDVRVCFAFDN